MDLATHWDTVYSNKDTQTVSWYQPRPTVSLELIERVGGVEDGIIDVGAGASTLVDHLLEKGHTDISLLDISTVALQVVMARLGDVHGVRFEAADLRVWRPDRTWKIWHDRAVFHFLTEESERRAYREALRRALEPGGHAIISTFHDSGPERCSDLPTTRYHAEALLEALGGPDVFELVDEQQEQHAHPRGGYQAFQVVMLRRR